MGAIRNQEPIHSAAILPLHKLTTHTGQMRRDAGNKPLTSEQKQTFLSLSVDVLKVMGFTAEDILAMFPPLAIRTSTPPPVVNGAPGADVKTQVVPVPTEKKGLFTR